MLMHARRRTAITFHWIAYFVLALALLALTAEHARAEGGKAVSTAPVVPYGVHETGNTASGGGGKFAEYCEDQFEPNLNSFWQLPVVVGDHITIDWGAVILGSTCLTVYPIGTSDYGLQTATPEDSTEQGSNGKQQMKLVAPATGNLILDFAATAFHSGCSDCAGPYEFTAYVQHALQLSLSAPEVLPTNGIVSAGVTQNTGALVPDGLTFWLLAKWYEDGEKRTYSTAAVTAGGVVSFPLALPYTAAGHTVRLTAGHAEDSQYAEVLSNTVTARLSGPVYQHRRHRHRRHRHHHRHHHHHHRHHHR